MLNVASGCIESSKHQTRLKDGGGRRVTQEEIYRIKAGHSSQRVEEKDGEINHSLSFLLSLRFPLLSRASQKVEATPS